ncbi:hypothetical protein PGQ11_009120 [Apiospora arundinis]|uniref:Uncharacterized protein n=1 Tax=Apiospora arundinis TaxID=335852 RepID=A0ABR2IH31_9PEZI
MRLDTTCFDPLLRLLNLQKGSNTGSGEETTDDGGGSGAVGGRSRGRRLDDLGGALGLGGDTVAGLGGLAGVRAAAGLAGRGSSDNTAGDGGGDALAVGGGGGGRAGTNNGRGTAGNGAANVTGTASGGGDDAADGRGGLRDDGAGKLAVGGSSESEDSDGGELHFDVAYFQALVFVIEHGSS